MSRLLVEKDNFIEGFGREFVTLKTSYESSVKNALDRAEATEAKEKSATEASKLSENKRRAAEEKLQKAVNEAPILWAEMSRLLVEKDNFIEGFGREFVTLKTSYESSVKNALDRAEATEAKEKSATEASKLSENKRRAAEEKLQKAVNE
ncbi:hypothetical protein Dimus_010997, partial [Dionaea muscipula]